MKIAVIGAAGRTGREVVQRALERGHHVTAVARNPDAIVDADHPDLSVAAADAHDDAALTTALQGVETVVSTLGARPRQPTTLYSHGIATIEKAMRAVGAHRLICLSAGALDIGPHIPLAQRVVTRAVVRLFFRDAYTDMARMETYLHGCDLDWTAVRVPGLTDKPAAYHYRVAQPPPLDRPSWMSRTDLAGYLVSILYDPTTYQKVIEIST